MMAVLFAAGMWAARAIAPGASFRVPGRAWLGGALAVAGGAFAVAGVAAFRRAKTTVNPLTPSAASAIVSTGVYRISRNPMYVGVVAILLGWGLWLENALALALAAVFAAYLHRFQILPEERALAGKFGPGYDAYARKVRRWL